MNSRATRRRELIAEAEAHRDSLADEWGTLSGQAAALQERGKAVAAQAAGWAAAGVAVGGGIRLLLGKSGTRRPRAPAGRLFAMARTGFSLWLMLRPLLSSLDARTGGRPRRSSDFSLYV